MRVHVLPGSSLIEGFRKTNITGEVIICRECLIDGDLKSKSLKDFWKVRETYLTKASPKPPTFYQTEVRGEFEKLLNLREGAEVNLWFEHELFCQVNMWFCLSLLADKALKCFRVAPPEKYGEERWKGFGELDQDELEPCFSRRIEFAPQDVDLGRRLWDAFSARDFASLTSLSDEESECFKYLKEVCQAAAEIDTRPKNALQRIIEDGGREFGPLFQEFIKTEGIYGFGDLQVRRIFDEIV